MPKSITKSAVIHRTPAQVLSWTEDWGNVRAWMGESLVSIDILSEHAESDPICAGMRFRETRQMGKMKAKAIITVEKHELDGDRAVHEAICDDGCNRWLFEYRFEPTQDNHTNATWIASSAPNKWWTKALNPITAPMMIKMMNKCEGDHLDKLKALIESD